MIPLAVMTYNVHSCVGSDGRLDPLRVARVIGGHDADVVALQELDSGLARTGRVDQAKLLADILEMNHHFHPSLHGEAGRFGNAVLSPHSMRLFRAGELPTLPGRRIRERRGAIWLKLEAGRGEVEVFNTHLGLSRHERLAQAAALKGPEWLGHPECRGPVIFCGDLNTTRWSGAYRTLRHGLVDVGGARTWPGRFPFIQVDYIFASPDIAVRGTTVPRDDLTRRASDHLPVLATLEVPERGKPQ